MEVEDVAREGLAARRTAQQQRHLAIGGRLLGEVVIDNHRMHAVIAEILAHGAARIGRQELQRRGVGRRGGDDDGVFHRAVFLERLDHLGHGGALLADGDIDAVELFRLVVALVDLLLVDEGVDGDCGLAGLPVADDEFALAAPDGHQRVERLEARLHRLVHRAARDDAGRLDLDQPALGRFDRTLAVDGVAESVHHAAEEALADRHIDDGGSALDEVAFVDVAVLAEDHHAHIVRFEVERHAARAVGELDHLAGLHAVEAVDPRHAVAHGKHRADFGDIGFVAEIGDLVLEDRGDFGGVDIHAP